MKHPKQEFIQYHKTVVEDLFRNKNKFHAQQALLPIEDKIKILISLQKVVITIIRQRNPDDPRQPWNIE